MSREEIEERLNVIESLEDNWNENGAKAFSEMLVAWARCFLNIVPLPDCISPTANGSIQIEYERIDGTYVEYELFDDRIEEFNIINGREFEIEITTPYDLICSLSALKILMA